MPKYQIKTSQTNDLTLQYNFASTQAAKNYYCSKILGMNYDGGDGFTVSSNYFEEMGVLLSLYSQEKCYAIKSLSQSVNDLYRWGGYKSEYSGNSNRKIIGEDHFLNSIHKKCDQLFNKLALHVNDISNISMPKQCCEADNIAELPTHFSCTDDNASYRQMLLNIGCSEDEGVCDYSGEEYNIFQSDEL
jgi:hypothetical protein